MIAFSFLGNTLFLTILVSMLSNTFTTISANAPAEIQFRRAVLTLEGVKADAVFAYQPPFNILAVFLFLPLKFLVSPRWFHKIHVYTVRLINLPLLLIIAIFERRLLWQSPRSKTSRASEWISRRWRFSAHRSIRAVFDLPPPDGFHDDIAVDDELTHHLIRRQFTRQPTSDSPTTRKSSRRDSMIPGIPQKLRRSFTETTEDFDGMASRMREMEGAMERMEKMLARLLPEDSTVVATQDDEEEEDEVEVEVEEEEMGPNSKLRGADGFTSENSYRGV